MTNITVQNPRDVFSVRKRQVVNLNLGVLKSLVAFTALRVGGLDCLRQRNRLLGMASRTRGFFPTMAFEARFFRRTKCRWIVGIVVDIIVASGASILQLFYVETVWDGDVVRIDLRRGTLHLKDLLMATNAVRIDLVEFGRKAGVLSIALERKDIDARHQGMTRCMAFRAIDLGMHGRLLPKRGLSLLMMAGDAEFFLSRRIGGKGDGRIEHQDDQGSAQGPCPERKMWDFGNLEIHHVVSSVHLLTFI